MRINRRTVVLMAMLSLLTLALSACGARPQADNDSQPAPLASSAESKAGETGGPNEGIGFQGSWSIKVFDPDGGLVSSREFENALTQGGASQIGRYIRGFEPGGGPWEIRLSNSSSSATQPCGSPPGGTCSIKEARITRSADSADLVVSGNGAHTINLDGTVVVDNASAIDVVSSNHFVCSPIEYASDCQTMTFTGNSSTTMTRTTLANPVNVSAGQTVEVGVRLRVQ